MKWTPVLLGLVLVLGLPPALFLTLGDDPGARSVEEPQDPLRALIAQRSTLELVYQDWQTRHVARGGDRNAVIGLGWPRGLATEYSPALGKVELDLIAGSLAVEVEGLAGTPADVWLVDNLEGPGRSVIPEPGDRFVHLGQLREVEGRATVTARLGEGFFRRFELDLVVVSRHGKNPAESRLLLGSRSFFERLYTQERLAAERRHERANPFLAGLPRARDLFSLLVPVAYANSTQVLIAHGLVSQKVGDGADLFFRGTFSGNGRTCGTCHPPQNNQEIGPEFIATLPASDRLFVAEFSKKQGGVPGLERPVLMRNFGLILENVDGFESPTTKFAMRGVPHSLSMATSILAPADGRAPLERPGWSGDGAPAPGTLRLFSAGAVTQHFTKDLRRRVGTDFVLPTDAQLDAMEAFMLAVGRLNELNLSVVSVTDPVAQAGKTIFSSTGKCNNCHGNAGALSPFTGANPNFDTGVEKVPHPAQSLESFPLDGGFGTANRDCDGNGTNDCFGDGTFNTTPLIEAADTGPFFHNNVIDTIEGAVEFYSGPEFNSSPAGALVGGIALTLQESAEVAAFLRVLNAGFNLAISIQRNDAAITLENSSGGGGGGCLGTGDNPDSALAASTDSLCSGGGTNGSRATVDALLSLSNDEASDAVAVLQDRGLNPSAVSLIQQAIDKNKQAIAANASATRKSLMESAKADLASAKGQLGSGLDFLLGEGNLLF